MKPFSLPTTMTQGPQDVQGSAPLGLGEAGSSNLRGLLELLGLTPQVSPAGFSFGMIKPGVHGAERPLTDILGMFYQQERQRRILEGMLRESLGLYGDTPLPPSQGLGHLPPAVRPKGGVLPPTPEDVLLGLGSRFQL